MNVTITIDGKNYIYPKNTPIYEVARDVADQYDALIMLSDYNNRLRELSSPLTEDGELSFITLAHKNGRRVYKRSVILLMQCALEKLYPGKGYDIHVQYAMGNGYYCKAVGDLFIDDVFLTKLKDKMDELVKADLPIQKYEMKTVEAAKMFGELGMENKAKLLRYRFNDRISVYELDGVKDYFYGYMAPSTGMLQTFAFHKYDDGFNILFPDRKDLKKAESFEPKEKLLKALKHSSDWSNLMKINTIGALNDAIAAGKIQDIILMQEALMEQYIGMLAQKISDRKTCKFVMIAGPSSSGKTTFSHRLSVQLKGLGITPHPLPLDDYYLNRDQIPLDEYGEKDYEALEGLDIERFNADMTALSEGKEVEIPLFNFKTGKREPVGRMLSLDPQDVLIIEGIHGLNDKLSYSIPADKKFKIYISPLNMLAMDEHNPLSTADARLLRRIVRDARSRGTNAKETIARWPSVRRGEEKNIFPLQEEADAMFNTALLYELAVMKVYAYPQLFNIDVTDKEHAEANRLMKLLDYVLPMPTEDIMNTSLIREFIGGSIFNT